MCEVYFAGNNILLNNSVFVHMEKSNSQRRKCFQSRIPPEKYDITIINHFAKLNNYLPNVKTVRKFYGVYFNF